MLQLTEGELYSLVPGAIALIGSIVFRLNQHPLLGDTDRILGQTVQPETINRTVGAAVRYGAFESNIMAGIQRAQ